jgi:putative ABC transport system substrate-binding protein
VKTSQFRTLITVALATLSIGAAAQTPGKVYRVGVVGLGSGPSYAASLDGLSRSLAQHGYSVGVNLLIESRFAEAKPERLPALVKELLVRPADVIVTFSYPAARAAKEGTSTVPIVVTGAGDPVETGLVASFSQPGGNITGISDLASELSAKRLELLKTAVPYLKRVAMLWNADDLGMTARYRAAAAAASALGVSVQPLGVREPDDFDAAFAAMTREKPDGILMVSDSLTNLNRKRVFEFAAANRIPAIYELELLARDGGLMAYATDRSETIERAADLVNRVLKGAKPADLPVEQPTLFRFVINLKTAEALGLTVPQSLLARADEVIE